MEYYIPQTPQDDFKPALAGFILAMILAVAVGIFAGYGVRLFLGGDENVALTYQYTERMAAAKTVFSVDSYAYQTVAAQLQDTPGVRILRTADDGVVICDADGSMYTVEDYFTSVRPVESQTGGVVVFSEIYYPDWTATIDGQPAELGRVNYVLRALRVEPGHHEVVMSFFPKSIDRTETVAYAALIALLLLVVLLVIMESRRQRNK